MVQILATPEVITPEVIDLEVINPEVINLYDTDSYDINPYDILPLEDIESDEPELESSIHLQQIFLLISCLELLWQGRDDYFAAGNLTVYYRQEQEQDKTLETRKEKPIEFRGADFFVALSTQKRHRKSWVVYREGGVYPHVIVEILSDSTAEVDRTTKKLIYQNIFRTPDYFWFHPDTLEFRGFSLLNNHYVAMEPNDRGWLWSDQLGLFLGIHEQQLRYFTEAGELVPSPEESRVKALALVAEAERQVVEVQQQVTEVVQQVAEAEQRAEEAEQRSLRETQRAEEAIAHAEKLAAKLRELNIDPEQI